MESVIALVDDLMFLSRVREAARGAGVTVRPARGTREAVEAARAGACLVIVDLDSARLPWAEAVPALRAEPSGAGLPIVGFVSHVNAQAARAAREAGCTDVLARSAFVAELPGLLARAAGGAAPPETT